MLRYTLVRLLQAILVLWVVATVVFLLSRASGNAADLMVPQDAPPRPAPRSRRTWASTSR